MSLLTLEGEEKEPRKREPLNCTQRFWLSLAAIIAAWSYAMVGTILSMVGR